MNSARNAITLPSGLLNRTSALKQWDRSLLNLAPLQFYSVFKLYGSWCWYFWSRPPFGCLFKLCLLIFSYYLCSILVLQQFSWFWIKVKGGYVSHTLSYIIFTFRYTPFEPMWWQETNDSIAVVAQEEKLRQILLTYCFSYCVLMD